jgi:hypothetical protein
MEYYSYMYLRYSGLPYYIGKGKGNRAYQRVKNHNPPKDLSRIIIEYHDSEADALEAEKFLIAYFGRKDIGTGCLINKTDGGEGVSGSVAWNKGQALSENHIAALKLGQTGKPKRRSKEHAAKISDLKKLWWAERKKNGYVQPEEVKLKISAGLKEHYANAPQEEFDRMSKKYSDWWAKKKVEAANGTTG